MPIKTEKSVRILDSDDNFAGEMLKQNDLWQWQPRGSSYLYDAVFLREVADALDKGDDYV